MNRLTYKDIRILYPSDLDFLEYFKTITEEEKEVIVSSYLVFLQNLENRYEEDKANRSTIYAELKDEKRLLPYLL